MAVHVGGKGPGHLARTQGLGGIDRSAYLDLQFGWPRSAYWLDGGLYDTFGSVPGAISTGGAGFGQALRGGSWSGSLPDGTPLIGDGGLGVGEARTNKCSVVQINPVNTSGITALAGGGVAPTISVVGAPELEALGLGSVAYRIDNTANSNPTHRGFAVLAGQVGSTDQHVGVVYVRGGAGDLRDNAAGGAITFPASATFQPRKIVWTPGATTRQLTVAALGGEIVDFIAPNLKLGPDINDPPILQTSGLAATRTAVTQSVGGLGSILTPPFVLFVEADLPAIDGTTRVLADISDNTIDNRVTIFRASNNVMAVTGVNAGAVSNNALSLAGYTGARSIKAAVRVRSNNYLGAADGFLGTQQTLIAPPIHTLKNGYFVSTGSPLNGNVRRVAILPDMSDAALQALTA